MEGSVSVDGENGNGVDTADKADKADSSDTADTADTADQKKEEEDKKKGKRKGVEEGKPVEEMSKSERLSALFARHEKVGSSRV